MGVKSTVTISREVAESRVIDAKIAAVSRILRASYQSTMREYSDENLEDYLEEESDRLAGGEGFTNFQIVD